MNYVTCLANRLFYLSVLNSAFLFLFLSSPAKANSDTELERYGKLPALSGFSLSPSGKLISWLEFKDDATFLVVADSKTIAPVGGLKIAPNIKARGSYFANEDHIILLASDTTSVSGYIGRFEYSAAISYSIKSKKERILLKDAPGLHPAQAGLGEITYLDKKTSSVYMPAYAKKHHTDKYGPRMMLYQVSLDTGKVKVHDAGNNFTLNWFLGENAKVLAREDFNPHTQEHNIYAYTNKNSKPILIYNTVTSRPNFSLLGLSKDEKSLVYLENYKDNDALYYISLATGKISEPLFYREGKDIESVIFSKNKGVVGIEYSGVKPEYEFQDAEKNLLIARLQATFPGNLVEYLQATKGFKKILFKVSGNDYSGTYMIFDRNTTSITKIADNYPSIQKNDIAEISTVRYKSRDQRDISAILTWPQNTNKLKTRKQLPLLVFPHGGPASYDRAEFDWWAQYFATQGYLVFQPNFRGSSGFGTAHEIAGYGEWGAAMQNDISDGVDLLVKKGIADKSKICIMGASYGGYAALVGGAFTPELYRCVIAMNGLSDLKKMMSTLKADYSKKSITYDYWMDQLGNPTDINETLPKVSPANFADEFKAATLIIYSKDDTVVLPSQSRYMYKKLKKAGKSVELVALKGDDHWLSVSATRLQALKAMSDFIKKHNPVEP